MSFPQALKRIDEATHVGPKGPTPQKVLAEETS
jgi:hypothetical protein